MDNSPFLAWEEWHSSPIPIMIWIKVRIVFFIAFSGEVWRRWPIAHVFTTLVIHECIVLIKDSSNAGIFRGKQCRNMQTASLTACPHPSCFLPHETSTVNTALYSFGPCTFKHINGTYCGLCFVTWFSINNLSGRSFYKGSIYSFNNCTVFHTMLYLTSSI